MKKIKIQGKLSLNKTTVANLNREQTNNVKGGGPTKTEIKCPQTFTDVMTMGTCDWLSANTYC